MEIYNRGALSATEPRISSRSGHCATQEKFSPAIYSSELNLQLEMTVTCPGFLIVHEPYIFNPPRHNKIIQVKFVGKNVRMFVDPHQPFNQINVMTDLILALEERYLFLKTINRRTERTVTAPMMSLRCPSCSSRIMTLPSTVTDLELISFLLPTMRARHVKLQPISVKILKDRNLGKGGKRCIWKPMMVKLLIRVRCWKLSRQRP